MRLKKEILTNIDGLALLVLAWAFILNLIFLIVVLVRYYIFDTGSWRTVEESFVFGVAVVIAVLFVFLIFGPIYRRIVKALSDPVVDNIESRSYRRPALKFIRNMFECSEEEARAIDKFWKQISIDLIRLARPSVCTPIKIFEESEKADEWSQKVRDYEKDDFLTLNPKRSGKIQMFRYAASIDAEIDKIREFCASTTSIVDVSDAEIIEAFKEYISLMLSKPPTQEEAPYLMEKQRQIIGDWHSKFDVHAGRTEAHDLLAKGLENFTKISENPKAQQILRLYR